MSSVERTPGGRIYASIIVGGGPGGLGPLLWAAKQGELEGWLRCGVAVVERAAHLGGRLGRYAINSDSLGGSYLECLDFPGLPQELRSLRDDPVTIEMARHRIGYPPLHLVDRHMRALGQALEAVIRRCAPSQVRLETTASAARLRRDGLISVTIEDASNGRQTMLGRSLVLALGGRQGWRSTEIVPGLALEDCRPARVLPSDVLFTAAGLAEADALLATAGDRPIVILGGSHSAYAAAWALAHQPAARALGNGQIKILQRRRPRIFYPDATAAQDDAYPVVAGDLCPRTRRVNRMGGLRGHGRDIWREIGARPGTARERRIAPLPLQHFGAASLRALIEAAALVVPCFGYRAATLPMTGADGERLVLSADVGGDSVDDDCRVRLADGRSLPNVFGIGLGSGFRTDASMGCEPNFSGQVNSLWLYQNDIGALIHRAIRSLPEAASAAEAPADIVGNDD